MRLESGLSGQGGQNVKSGERVVILEFGAEGNCCRDQFVYSGKLGTGTGAKLTRRTTDLGLAWFVTCWCSRVFWDRGKLRCAVGPLLGSQLRSLTL